MTLTTHAVVGAAFSSAFSLNPGASLAAGFLTHFLIDRLPHWDYKLRSAKIDENNPLNFDWPITRAAGGDFLRIGLDILIGLGLALVFFTSNGQGNWLSILAGAVGGIIPDALQFIYTQTRREPFTSLQRFHILMDSPLKIKNLFYGLLTQLVIIWLALILGNWTFFI